MAEYVVQLTEVVKSFGELRAVDRVSLNVRPGEFLTLLGPSGCGKTTTLRMIGGFESPDAGEILIQGKNVTGVPPAERNTSMVFQDYALFPHMTVAENIAFGLRSLACGLLHGVGVLPFGQCRRCLLGQRCGDLGAHARESLGCGVAGLWHIVDCDRV